MVDVNWFYWDIYLIVTTTIICRIKLDDLLRFMMDLCRLILFVHSIHTFQIIHIHIHMQIVLFYVPIHVLLKKPSSFIDSLHIKHLLSFIYFIILLFFPDSANKYRLPHLLPIDRIICTVPKFSNSL